MTLHRTVPLSSALIAAALLLVLQLQLRSVHGQPVFVPDEFISGVPVSTDARYRCAFRNLWTPSSHPTDYPVGNAAWDEQIFVTHAGRYTPWRPDSEPTSGFATLAMTGDSLQWTVEALSQVDAVTDIEIGSVFTGSAASEKQIGVIRLSSSTPFLTTMTRMIPSPDWFTGISRLDLRQNTQDPSSPVMWYRSFEVDTYPFTAGTMSGTTYMDAGNELGGTPTIRQFTPETPPVSDSGVLLDSTETRILPVARWTCSLIGAVPIENVIIVDEPTTNVPPGGTDTTPTDIIDDGSVILAGQESIVPTMDNTLVETTVETMVDEDDSSPTMAPTPTSKSATTGNVPWPREPLPGPF